MAAIAEIAGNVQFFHPSDGAAATDWQDFLQYAMLRASQLRSDTELVPLLRELFGGLAPSVRFDEPSAGYELPADAKLLVWSQNGYPDEVYAPGAGNIYARQRVIRAVSALGSEPGMPTAPLLRYRAAGVEVMQPLVQRSDGTASLPASRAFAASQWSGQRQFGEPATCLAEVARIWNVIRNFWAYHDRVKPVWEAELPRLLASCDPQPGQQQASLNAARQIRLSLSKLQDNHVSFRSGLERQAQRAPFVAQTIEGRTLIVEVLAGTVSLQKGDELLAVDGKSVEELLAPMMAESLGSEARSRDRLLGEQFLVTPEARQYRLELVDAQGARREQVVKSVPWVYLDNWRAYDMSPDRPKLETLSDGLLVVNVSQLTPEDTTAALAAMSQARGIVLDLRSYPVPGTAWRTLLARLAAKRLASLPMYNHLPYAPGPAYARVASPQFIDPVGPRIAAPVVVLSSRNSISQNEHALGYVQSAGLRIVGEPTMGINGNITGMKLLSGAGDGAAGFLTFTGLEVTQHDGSALIGVGIQPTVLKARTVDGFRAGRDEVLEAGLAYLRARL